MNIKDKIKQAHTTLRETSSIWDKTKTFCYLIGFIGLALIAMLFTRKSSGNTDIQDKIVNDNIKQREQEAKEAAKVGTVLREKLEKQKEELARIVALQNAELDEVIIKKDDSVQKKVDDWNNSI